MSFLVVIGIAVGLAMDAFAVAVGTSVSLGRVDARQVFRFAFHFGLFQAAMPIVGWLAGRGLDVYITTWDHWLAFALLAAIGTKAIVTAIRGGGADAGRSDVGRAPLRPPQPRPGRGDINDSLMDSGAPLALRRAQGHPPYIAPTPSEPSGPRPEPVEGQGPDKDPTRGWSLLGLSVATSIDALAVGLTLGVLAANIWLAVLIIGVVTAALTTLGMHLGSHLGSLFGKRFSRATEIAGGLVLLAIGIKILVEHLIS